MMRLFTVGDAAKELHVSVDSVRRFEREGMLSAVKVGVKGMRLFRPADIERLKVERERRNSERQRATQ